MGHQYVHGLKNQRRRRWDFILVAVLLLAIGGGYLYVRVLTGNPKAVVDDTRNVATTKVFGEQSESIFRIEEDLFTMSIEGGEWEQYKVLPAETNVYRYRAKGFDQGRSIEVFVDSLPRESDLHMTHLLPIQQPEGTTEIQIDQMSDLCRKFAPLENDQTTGVVKAKWKDIEFDCDVHRYRNVVGTSNAEDGYALEVAGVNGDVHTFWFRYTDHGSQPDVTIMPEILQTFRINY